MIAGCWLEREGVERDDLPAVSTFIANGYDEVYTNHEVPQPGKP